MKAPARVALFANRDSNQIEALRECVVAAGGEPLVFDIQLGPASGVRMRAGPGGIAWNGVDLSTVRAAHIRCTAPNTLPLLPPVLNQASHAELRASYLREQEYVAATHAFFDVFVDRGGTLVNPLTSAYLDHNAKAQFYHRLAAAGIPVPRTLTSDDPAAVLAFIEAVGEAVAKPQIGVGSTRLVTAADRERIDELTAGPVLFQERIHGPTIRVHVVGGTMVLALRILSDDTVDSRTGTRGFEYHALPEPVRRWIVRAHRLLGLCYSAWDLIVDEAGRYYALDCNPGPYLMWIGPDNVRFVLTELARLLVQCARGASPAEAAAGVRSAPPPR